MSNLVDEEAFKAASEKDGFSGQMDYFNFVQAYETAKLEKHNAADKQPLPELPEKYSDQQLQKYLPDGFAHKINQILTYLEALNKRMGQV